MYTRTTRLTARRMAGTASLALAMLALGCSSTVDPKGTVPEPPATVPPPVKAASQPAQGASQPASAPRPAASAAPSPARPVAAAVAPAPAPPPAPAPAAMSAQRSAMAGAVAGSFLPGGVPRPVPVPTPTARYQTFDENPWKRTAEEPVSTFSADVDTGSYANVRRFINRGTLPPRDAVRVEEMVNYFGYDYTLPAATATHPFHVDAQVAASPWNASRTLVRIAIKGKDVAKTTLPPANLVFLVDVSGSMAPIDRLPLVKSSLKLLVTQLRAVDRVTIVSYANGTKLVLPPTPGDQRDTIGAAIDSLNATGGTYGEAGIRMAYAQARMARIAGGINRVLLATDGDLNIGVTDAKELKELVEAERRAGTGLTTLGVGDSNYNEALMKQLADAGDGSYHYLDTLQEALKVLVNQFTSTLAVIAQDVKLQVEFNPGNVDEYRLIGYELRALKREDFANDQVDAGDIGAGHTVTALYELVPRGAPGNVEALRYQPAASVPNARPDELAWIKLRYKEPGAKTSKLIEMPLRKPATLPAIDKADTDFRFAAAVAGWGQWLRGSTLIGDWGPDKAMALAQGARGTDRFGHRAEFVRIVELSKSLKK